VQHNVHARRVLDFERLVGPHAPSGFKNFMDVAG